MNCNTLNLRLIVQFKKIRRNDTKAQNNNRILPNLICLNYIHVKTDMNNRVKLEWWTSLSEIWQKILLMNLAIDKKLKESKTPNFSAFTTLTERYKRVLKEKFKIESIPITGQVIDDILKLDNISCNGFPITRNVIKF